MSDISKISIGGTDYDIKDSVARGIVSPVNFYTGDLTSGSINFLDGTIITSDLKHTDYISTDDIDAIVYTNPNAETTDLFSGMAFYDSSKDFISGNSSNVMSPYSSGYQLKRVDVPSGAKYARFTWDTDAGTFAVYDAAQYDAAYETVREMLRDKIDKTRRMIATVIADSGVTTMGFQTGDIFIWKDMLCEATSDFNIVSDTAVIGTNCKQTTLAKWIAEKLEE